ncbi:hypothetical protein LEMLEM_LOCUS21373 [Lemmus lemmus]
MSLPLGSCSQPHPLCCPGTDHHCQRGRCYCDEFCLVLSDCCPDHRALCNSDDLNAGSLPPVAQQEAVTDRAAHTPKMVLQMMLRTRSRNDSANSNQDWVQSMVSAWESPLLGLGGNLLLPLCKRRRGEGRGGQGEGRGREGRGGERKKGKGEGGAL